MAIWSRLDGATLRNKIWEEGGMPVIGSSLTLSSDMVHEGVIRRSEDEFSEITCKGTSAMAEISVRYWLVYQRLEDYAVWLCLSSFPVRLI